MNSGHERQRQEHDAGRERGRSRRRARAPRPERRARARPAAGSGRTSPRGRRRPSTAAVATLRSARRRGRPASPQPRLDEIEPELRDDADAARRRRPRTPTQRRRARDDDCDEEHQRRARRPRATHRRTRAPRRARGAPPGRGRGARSTTPSAASATSSDAHRPRAADEARIEEAHASRLAASAGSSDSRTESIQPQLRAGEDAQITPSSAGVIAAVSSTRHRMNELRRPGGSSRTRTSGTSSTDCSAPPPIVTSRAAVAERLGHPHELVEEHVDPRQERLVEKIPVLVEAAVDAREVHVPEDRDETELPEDRDDVLDRPRASEDPGGDTGDPDRLVDVLRADSCRARASADPGSRGCTRATTSTSASARFIVSANSGSLADSPASSIGNRQRRDVDELGLDSRSLPISRLHESRGMLAHPPLARRPEDDRNEERPRQLVGAAPPTRWRNT